MGKLSLRQRGKCEKKALDADAIVAIGAGKLSDTAKNVAEILDLDLIIVPTLACACAAYSPYSVDQARACSASSRALRSLDDPS